jgi:hypothetical protein
MLRTRTSTLALALALVTTAALTTTSCGGDDDDDDFDEGDSTLTVVNDSSFVLTEIHLAPVDAPTWGPNMIPDELFPGEEVVIVDIECDFYDVLVTDKTGVDCELTDFDLCFDDATWIVDDATLDSCAFAL